MNSQNNSGTLVNIVVLLASTASMSLSGYSKNVPIPVYNYTIKVPSRKNVSYSLVSALVENESCGNIIKMRTIKKLSIKIRKSTKLTLA